MTKAKKKGKANTHKAPEGLTTTRARVLVCFELLLDGWTQNDIARQVAAAVRKQDAGEELTEAEKRLTWREKGAAVVDRTVRRYCLAARAEFEQVQALKREQALGSSLARREKLFRLATERGDLGTARLVQNDIDRLMGLTNEFNPGATDEEPQGIRLPSGAVVFF